MVGTRKMVSIFCSSISRRNSSGSNRGINTSAPPETTGAQAKGIRRGMIQVAPAAIRGRHGFKPLDHRAHPPPSTRSCSGVGALRSHPPLGLPRGARGVDHVLRLRQHRAVIGPLPFEPDFEIGRKTGRGEVIRIDLVIR